MMYRRKAMGDFDKELEIREAENYKQQKKIDAQKKEIEEVAKKNNLDVGTVQYQYSRARMVKMGERLEKAYLSDSSPIFDSIKDVTELEDCVTDNDKLLFQLRSSLEAFTTKLKEYGTTKMSFMLYSMKKQIKEEREKIKLVEKEMDVIEDRINDLMLDEFSDKPEFQAFLQDYYDVSANFTSLRNGGLAINYNEYENGKDVYRVRGQNPDVSKAVAPDYIKKGYKVLEFNTTWTSIDSDLFDHEPCPEDIIQGGLGDCYFMSALTAIAAQDPDRIRNMICHNPNNHTVTVKFYNAQFEPYYVTVDDTLPSYDMKVRSKEGVETTIHKDSPFSKGPNWLKFFEKAYAASGLHLQGLESQKAHEIAAGYVKPSYADIDGGQAHKMMAALLGPDGYKKKGSLESAIDSEEIEIDNSKLAKKAKAAEKKIRAEGTRKAGIPKYFPSEYLKEEMAIYNKMKAAYDAGRPVSVSTPHVDGVGDKQYEKYKGLPPNHAYSVIGFKEGKNGLLFVEVRNPHADGVRTYDKDGKPILKQTAITNPTTQQQQKIIDNRDKGISRIELRDFIASFERIYTAQFDKLPAQRDAISKGDAMKSLYGEVITKMCNSIAKTDSYLGRITDSKEFSKLRKQAVVTRKLFAKKNVTDAEIRTAMNNLFDKAEGYRTYRDNEAKSSGGDQKEKSIKRYVSADVLCELKNAFLENENAGLEKAKAIDPDKIRDKVMTLKEGASEAKKAAVAGLENMKKKTPPQEIKSGPGYVARSL